VPSPLVAAAVEELAVGPELVWIAEGAVAADQACDTELDSDDSCRRRWRNRLTVVVIGVAVG